MKIERRSANGDADQPASLHLWVFRVFRRQKRIVVVVSCAVGNQCKTQNPSPVLPNMFIVKCGEKK